MSVLIPNDRVTMNADKLRIKRVNRTHPHLLIGEFELFTDLGDDYENICYSYKKASTGNSYKRMPYKFGPVKFCEFVNNEKIFYPEIQKVSDLPAIGACPHPKGVYHIRGFQPDESRIPAVFGSGDYMVECQLRKIGKEEKIVQGFKIYATVLNLRSL